MAAELSHYIISAQAFIIDSVPTYNGHWLLGIRVFILFVFPILHDFGAKDDHTRISKHVIFEQDRKLYQTKIERSHRLVLLWVLACLLPHLSSDLA